MCRSVLCSRFLPSAGLYSQASTIFKALWNNLHFKSLTPRHASERAKSIHIGSCRIDVSTACTEGPLNIMEKQTRFDFKTYASLLQRCANAKALLEGKWVHAHLVKTRIVPDTFLGKRLVNMYAKCGSLDDARQVFVKMSQRDLAAWNAMIDGYAKFGSLEDARQMFGRMPQRDLVSWNTMIAGYAQNGCGEEALKLFGLMQREEVKSDQFTLGSVLKACASLAALEVGMQVHARAIKTAFESDVFAGSALIDMYAKCGCVENAHQVFDKMPERNGISWSALVAGHAQNGRADEALELFRQMQQSGIKPNPFTFSSVLMACARLQSLERGKEVHNLVRESDFESDVFVGSALVDMYAKCGNIEMARHVFDKMPERNAVSWNAIIAGCAQNGFVEEALKLFCQMHRVGVNPTEVTFASALRACGSLATLGQGIKLHGHITKVGFEANVFVGSALVYMYAKCGEIDDAQQVFDKMPARNVVTWNAIIAGHAQHGRGKEALQLFKQMQCVDMRPNHITFVCVLSACSHVGLIDEGRHYFDSMIQDHGIVPGVEHYACMVDLFGRAGHLDDAERLILRMPLEPGAFLWRTLLGACAIHGNIEHAEHAAEHVLELEPEDSATYVLLSNMYATAGRWNDVGRVRKLMKDRGVKKEQACSWIEIKNKIHTFAARDRSHPQTEQIYAKLDDLTRCLKNAGYVPNVNCVLYDVERE